MAWGDCVKLLSTMSGPLKIVCGVTDSTVERFWGGGGGGGGGEPLVV